jgi:hypothetical protein
MIGSTKRLALNDPVTMGSDVATVPSVCGRVRCREKGRGSAQEADSSGGRKELCELL